MKQEEIKKKIEETLFMTGGNSSEEKQAFRNGAEFALSLAQPEIEELKLKNEVLVGAVEEAIHVFDRGISKFPESSAMRRLKESLTDQPTVSQFATLREQLEQSKKDSYALGSAQEAIRLLKAQLEQSNKEAEEWARQFVERGIEMNKQKGEIVADFKAQLEARNKVIEEVKGDFEEALTLAKIVKSEIDEGQGDRTT